MKLNEFEIDRIVKDDFGNLYKVTNVSYDGDYQPVKLLCIVNSAGKNYITRPNNTYYEFKAGCEWWITEDELKDFSIVEN